MACCLFIGVTFPTAAKGAASRYQFVNHGFLLNVHLKNSNLHPDFTAAYQKNLVKANQHMASLVEKNCSSLWRFQSDNESDRRALMLNNTVNMAMVITRAGVNQEVIDVSSNVGQISHNTFNIGLALVFFKLTGQADRTGVQLYYSRFITAAKVINESRALTESERRKYFIDALFEGTELLLKKAVAEYRPGQITGKVVRIKGNQIVTDLGRKAGLKPNELVQIRMGRSDIDFLVIDVALNQSTITPFDPSDKEIFRHVKQGMPISALVNSAKRLIDSYEVFQVKKLKIKVPEFKKDKEDLLQIFHDYLAQTAKINMLPSTTTISEDVKDTIRTRFNIGYCEFNAPEPDYFINAVLQKSIVTQEKGDINTIKTYFAYGKAGVLSTEEQKTVLCKQKANAVRTSNIVKDQTHVEREEKYDTVQLLLKKLAQNLADNIPNHIHLSY